MIRDLAQVGGAAENLYNDAMVWHREITHVAPENAIFVEDFRVSGAPVGGGAIDASRGLYILQCGIVFSHAVWRLALLRMLRRVAAADLPGLRPFHRGSRQ